MSYQATIEFKENDETYLTFTTRRKEESNDMVLDVIVNMLSVLSIGDVSYNDEIIDNLIRRCEQLRCRLIM